MSGHDWLLIVYLAVVLPPLLWLLGALYVMLYQETRRWWRRSEQ